MIEQTDVPAASDGSPDRARTVLVTGAAWGVGRTLALGFAAQGDRVVVADLDVDGARETVALIEADGGAARAVGVDVTVLNSARAMALTAADFSSENGGPGRIDIVINGAALRTTLTRAPFTALDVDEWDRVMAVNLRGPWLVTRACSRFLSDSGKVINLSSAAVMSGSAPWAHYMAAEGGVIALTRALARELGARGITVNAIAGYTIAGYTGTEPGEGVEQGLGEGVDGEAEDDGVRLGVIPRAGEPGDIVGAALFLAGPGSNYITGQTLVVDGGRQFS